MDIAGDLLQPQGDDPARIAWYIRGIVSKYQNTFSVIEKVTFIFVKLHELIFFQNSIHRMLNLERWTASSY